jgi:hypothetical protein
MRPGARSQKPEASQSAGFIALCRWRHSHCRLRGHKISGSEQCAEVHRCLGGCLDGCLGWWVPWLVGALVGLLGVLLVGERAESRAKPQAGAKAERGLAPDSAPIRLRSAFCLLRRRPAQSGCCAEGRETLVADDELRGRGRESRANPELRLRTRSPPLP